MEWGRWLDKVSRVYSIDGSENENVWKFALAIAQLVLQ